MYLQISLSLAGGQSGEGTGSADESGKVEVKARSALGDIGEDEEDFATVSHSSFVSMGEDSTK
jgi:hypothetical protein